MWGGQHALCFGAFEPLPEAAAEDPRAAFMRVRDLGRELVSRELSKSGEFCLLSWQQEMLQLLPLIPWPTTGL